MKFKESVVGYLKKTIPKNTPIYNLYGDGQLYYLIRGVYYPIDFNDGKHPEFIDVCHYVKKGQP